MDWLFFVVPNLDQTYGVEDRINERAFVSRIVRGDVMFRTITGDKSARLLVAKSG